MREDALKPYFTLQLKTTLNFLRPTCTTCKINLQLVKRANTFGIIKLVRLIDAFKKYGSFFKIEMKEITILSKEHAFDKVAIVASEQNVLHYLFNRDLY